MSLPVYVSLVRWEALGDTYYHWSLLSSSSEWDSRAGGGHRNVLEQSREKRAANIGKERTADEARSTMADGETERS